VAIWPSILLISFIAAEITYGVATNWEAKLLKDLFVSYEPQARPLKSHKDAVDLRFEIALVSATETSPGTFGLTVWITQQWRDEYLTWDPAAYDGLKEIKIHPQIPGKGYVVWTPDITAFGGEAQNVDTGVPKRIVLAHDGNVTWVVPRFLKIHCSSSEGRNNVTCKPRFGSWVFMKREVDIRVDERIYDEVTPNSEWILAAGSKVEKSDRTFANEVFQHIDVTFNLAKRVDQEQDRDQVVVAPP